MRTHDENIWHLTPAIRKWNAECSVPADNRADRMPYIDRRPAIGSNAALQEPDDGRLGATGMFGRRQSPALRSRSEMSGARRVLRSWFVGVVLLFASPLAAADKVDIVHLKNGDRL